MAADPNAVVAVANPGSISGHRSSRNGVGLSSFRACFLRSPVSYGQIVESLIWRAGFQGFGELDFRDLESRISGNSSPRFVLANGVSSRSVCATTHRVHRAEDIPSSCSHSAKARPASPRSLLGGWSTLSSPRRYAMPRNCGSIRARLLDKQYGGSDLGNVSQYGWSPKRDKLPRN